MSTFVSKILSYTVKKAETKICLNVYLYAHFKSEVYYSRLDSFQVLDRCAPEATPWLERLLHASAKLPPFFSWCLNARHLQRVLNSYCFLAALEDNVNSCLESLCKATAEWLRNA